MDEALYDLSAWPYPALDLLSASVGEVGHVEGEVVEEEVIVRLLQCYLLSTTAKDLSLMILLQGPHYR